MSEEAKQMVEHARLLTERARGMCDHANHRHGYDSDGPGYTCNECGEYGYGPCGFCFIERVALGYDH